MRAPRYAQVHFTCTCAYMKSVPKVQFSGRFSMGNASGFQASVWRGFLLWIVLHSCNRVVQRDAWREVISGFSYKLSQGTYKVTIGDCDFIYRGESGNETLIHGNTATFHIAYNTSKVTITVSVAETARTRSASYIKSGIFRSKRIYYRAPVYRYVLDIQVM